MPLETPPVESQGKTSIFNQLRVDILRLQGFKPASASIIEAGLGPILSCFPENKFPTGTIHEFLTDGNENLAASSGFISGLASSLNRGNGIVMWILTKGKIYPPALMAFGLNADRTIFTFAPDDHHALWVMEESLKCDALSAVICEIKGLEFTASRRLQLAVEQSGVTGFVLRSSRNPATSASVSRWQITPGHSITIDDLPGVGIPCWNVKLIRVRNGRGGLWEVGWMQNRFHVKTVITNYAEERQWRVG